MQLTIETSNKELFEKIVWLLNALKSEGVKIVSNSEEKLKPYGEPTQNEQ